MSDLRKIQHIQILRAVAAILVVFAHMGHELITRDVSDPYGILLWMANGKFGVDIFFVISGFIMYHVVAGRESGLSAAISFFKKRLIRIVPLYWFYSLLLLLPVILAPTLLNRTEYSIFYLLASLFFVPWPRPGTEDLSPFLAVGWTLNFEMLFYTFFALIIAIRIRNITTALLVTFTILSLAGVWINQEYVQIWFWTRTLLLEFVFGALVAMCFHRNIELPTEMGLLILLSGAVIWQASSILWPVEDLSLNIRGLTWGVAAALVVGAISLTPAIANALGFGGTSSLFHKIGDASYSLYLCHMFVVRIITLLFGELVQFNGVWVVLYFIVGITGCVLASLLSYRYIEIPVIRFGKSIMRTDKPTGKKKVVPSGLA